MAAPVTADVEMALQILARAARIYGPITIEAGCIKFNTQANLESFEAVLEKLFIGRPHTAPAYERVVRATLAPAARQFGRLKVNSTAKEMGAYAFSTAEEAEAFRQFLRSSLSC